MRRHRGRPLIPALIIALAVPFAACGDGEHKFTPEEFVETVNAEGAGLALGPAEPDDDGTEVHSVTLTVANTNVGSPTETPEAEHGSGTLLIAGDAGDAREVFERCEGDESLTCFRAANAVLRFEDMDGADQARIVTALEAIQTEDR